MQFNAAQYEGRRSSEFPSICASERLSKRLNRLVQPAIYAAVVDGIDDARSMTYHTFFNWLSTKSRKAYLSILQMPKPITHLVMVVIV